LWAAWDEFTCTDAALPVTFLFDCGFLPRPCVCVCVIGSPFRSRNSAFPTCGGSALQRRGPRTGGSLLGFWSRRTARGGWAVLDTQRRLYVLTKTANSYPCCPGCSRPYLALTSPPLSRFALHLPSRSRSSGYLSWISHVFKGTRTRTNTTSRLTALYVRSLNSGGFERTTSGGGYVFGHASADLPTRWSDAESPPSRGASAQ
jgi:hypothetical protein